MALFRGIFVCPFFVCVCMFGFCIVLFSLLLASLHMTHLAFGDTVTNNT